MPARAPPGRCPARSRRRGEPAWSGREAPKSSPSSVSPPCELSEEGVPVWRRPWPTPICPQPRAEILRLGSRATTAPGRGGERGETLGEASPSLSVVAQLVERNPECSELCGDTVAIGRLVESAVSFPFKLFDLFLQACDMSRQDGSRRLAQWGDRRPHRGWDQGGRPTGGREVYPRALDIRAERRCGRGRHCRDCGATAGVAPRLRALSAPMPSVTASSA